MARSKMKQTGSRNRPSSSMASGRSRICNDAACIADLEGSDEFPPARPAADSEPTKGEGEPSTKSSMSFGNGKGCSDEECIGIK